MLEKRSCWILNSPQLSFSGILSLWMVSLSFSVNVLQAIASVALSLLSMSWASAFLAL